MTFPTRFSARFGFVTASLLALASCGDGGMGDFDFDMRGFAGGFTTADAARDARTAARPTPDARGVISYPTYDVAVAREGETIAQMAGRLGLGPNELGRYNGIPPETALRGGEIIALPRQVGSAGTPGSATAGGTIDVTTLAGNALDRVGSGTAPASSAAAGPEPVRHQVTRGETAYSIARNYGVSVRSLAEWNSLDSALSVREGQYLLIPVVVEPVRSAALAEAPGVGSATPVPPSAGTPLPTETAAPAAATAAPSSPGLGAARTAASNARMTMPVDGSVVRAFEKGKTDGIDISASAGASVRAAAAGTVAAITRDTDQVPILVLRHSGNLLTVYAGIDNIKVEKGDSVSAGQVIANVRAANPSFLHFQVREGTLSVDPLSYLN
ncbi:peptidoglycan DD-metalloendopeptidase family protein [Sinisalibacter aestuarii]|uniref:Peptidase M23 n=1 Tax=Sinisalibacter aestuarii TaxID=2949426 RepID=A0ABQ5LVM5_9RHOB|nr:peptidoglycan DD-metalloendopeptidase family protein [Sinisalibacter aestuarii]GKY89039.1 peptidase M23 [Sinisalibacter aestuarii]